MKLKLKACGLVIGLSMAFGSLALAANVPAGVSLHDKQELTRNNGSEPETLDPANASGVPANNIIRDLFEGLTAVDSNGKVVPGVAESWKQVDPQTWVFKLRKNAKWSNGDGVTAEDFVYGMRRFVDPATASKYASTYGIFLQNAKDIIEGKKPTTELGVRAVDAYTLEIKTPFPAGFLPEVVSNLQLGPVHKATIDKHAKDWTKPANMVGNGAFTLKDWQVNSKIVLGKSPTYWDAKNVQLTKMTYLAVEEQNADVKLYESGENDWVYALPPGSYDKYKAQYPKDIRNSNIVNASPIVLTLLFTVLFVWVIPMSVLGAFIAIGLANLITFFFVFRKLLVKSMVKINWKYQEPVMKSMIKLGLVNAIAIFVMQLNYRMDILMLKQLSTFEQVGYYSLATQIAEQLWHIPFAIEMIILSRSANTTDNQFLHKTVASIFRVSLVIGIVLGAIIFFVAPTFVPLIFGEEFIPTTTMIRTILPGILILVGFRILNSRLTGMGKPQIAIYTFVPALLINFILNLILLPRYGGVGAAWATNVSYAVGSIAFLFVYARITKMSALQIFTFRKSDFYFFRDMKQYLLLRRSRNDANKSN